MDGTPELERRMFAEAPVLEVQEDRNGRTVIRGYAAVFSSVGVSQDLGGFIEDIDPRAFDDVMAKNPDVFGRFNHDRLLGRTTSGTMRLFVDERGLRYEIDPPASAADVVELISRGDVRGSSFAFRTSGTNEKWWRDAEGRTRRTILRFDSLHDAGPVEQPAYLGTETYVSKRALEAALVENRAAPDATAVGDYVSWESSGGRAQGRITRLVTEGEIDVPDSSFSINGTPDDPAALIRVYDDDGPTDVMVGHKASTLTKIDALPEGDDDDERSVGMRPTAGMASAARRGLKLHEEGKSGDGIKPETVARANKLARREEMNEDWIREMNAWFSRHDAGSKSPGWDQPPDYSPFFVARLLWGGTAAKNFAARKVKEMDASKERSAAPDPLGAAAMLKATVLQSCVRSSC